MIRAATARSPAMLQAGAVARRKLSSGPLEADSGAMATHTHHAMTAALAVMAPLYFMVPDSMTDGFVNKIFGVALSGTISAHSWIGLNYVCTDYVPKISKSLLGPSRIASAGMAVITFLGLTKVAISSPGGIKGCVKGLWNPKKE
eukprot:Nitzschia sp. Nitz4//scaffold121_size67750//2847//3281//NITZ4_006059-RA/size67750-processed-gene-0.14-mRNA-1//-1//CDS//3329534324//3579//frame0